MFSENPPVHFIGNISTKKIQIAHNKCIRFCLYMENIIHIGIKEFIKINWCAHKRKVRIMYVRRYIQIFQQFGPILYIWYFNPTTSTQNTRSSMLGLDQPARSKALGQKGICAQNYGIHFHHKLKLQKAQIHLKYAIKDVFLTSCKMLKNTIIIPKGEADFLTCYSFILFVTKF